jgi:hypothetical protein
MMARTKAAFAGMTTKKVFALRQAQGERLIGIPHANISSIARFAS